MSNPTLLTIAVICKNEEANIERCLSSIIRESVNFATEILVVDSYSTDRTVGLASRYPVKIIQLGRDWPHSPAAGRYTAVRHARGRYLLLVDGDMELLPGFISQALSLMEVDSSLVAVRGRLHNYYISGDKKVYVDSQFANHKASRKHYKDSQAPVIIRSATGCALFRLQSLREVGNFHPFLKAEEEYDIAQRLRARSGTLLYIPVDAVNHYGYVSDPIAEIHRRLRRGLVSGIGQMVGLSIQDGYGMENLWRFRQNLIFGFFFLLLGPCMLIGRFFPTIPMVWLFLCFLLLAVYCWKKKDFASALAAYLMNGLICIAIIKWLFVRLPDKDYYPTSVTIIPSSTSCQGNEE